MPPCFDEAHPAQTVQVLRVGYCRAQRADLRAARANRGFGTDEKHIRTKTVVMDKSKDGLDLLLSKIVDCARMCFSSVRNR